MEFNGDVGDSLSGFDHYVSLKMSNEDLEKPFIENKNKVEEK